jgi:ribosome-associated toxin RatA of RatAB toxin-antitoxin module
MSLHLAVLAGLLLGATAADPLVAPQVSVSEAGGLYSVAARFQIPQTASVALAVLSDYEQIPRFMPEVRRSVVLERGPKRLLVEQEAVSQFMMFSKRVHLVLEVVEEGQSIRFADQSGKSFKSYQGSWLAEPTDGGTMITYNLTARPGFDVPEFILKRLLKRDSSEMINRLRQEFAARAPR